MPHPPAVVIVGGGASGTLAAIHLLRAPANGAPLEVVLIDRDGRHALGQAYSTTDPRHLLNACAEKMSAADGDPGHLLAWAHANGLDVAGSDFLPREAYGRYLRHVLDTEARRAAPERRLTQVTGTACSLARPASGRPVHVRLTDGRVIEGDAVVLATGNPSPATPPALVGHTGERYIADPWAPGALGRIRDGAVLVMGTGLTMVDIALTVTSGDPRAVVYAVSRHGLLPRPHRHPSPPPVPAPVPEGPLTLTRLLRAVRTAVRDNGGDWHAVVDGLRPRVPELWSRLAPDDQRRFLRLVARYWEVHRHRLAPATAALVDELRATGRLRVLRGQVAGAVHSGGAAGVTGSRDALTVAVQDGGVRRDLRVGWLVNGTGPASGVDRDPFLARLLADGVVRPGPLGLGLDADAGGAVLDAEGRPSDRVFTLGPPLRGKWYETTAVPEIRAQAAVLAPRLVEAVTRPAALR
ncbi:FAD/NAD(P)-binding protein [Sphaerisporangium sp. NPDC051017]|uniref:FAD/NAD(P)-binding protein n=1 Tax=Sphaerisporangium sp. NPDC051017 TaxID=3154636 RepID=UPI003419FF2B